MLQVMSTSASEWDDLNEEKDMHDYYEYRDERVGQL